MKSDIARPDSITFLSGKALKEIGLKVDLKGDFDSKLIILEKKNNRNDKEI